MAKDAATVVPPGFIALREEDLELLLVAAANRGARQALEAVGLHDHTAGADIRDLRRLLESWRGVSGAARKAIAETLTRAAIKALLVILAGTGVVAWWTR